MDSDIPIDPALLPPLPLPALIFGSPTRAAKYVTITGGEVLIARQRDEHVWPVHVLWIHISRITVNNLAYAYYSHRPFNDTRFIPREDIKRKQPLQAALISCKVPFPKSANLERLSLSSGIP